MQIKFRVQTQTYQGPDQVQLQLAAVEGQANLNATRPADEAAEFPVGKIVTVTIESEDED
mgnify:CR=1 FL=1